MAKTKLTPTTNDQLQHQGNGLATAGTIPLQMAGYVQLPTPMDVTVEFPPVSLPPKKKMGRPKKVLAQEQKVNIPALAPEKKEIKIALVGTAPSSRMLAPYNDPSWTIWGCSPGNMNVIPRVDAWFEVHGTNLKEPENESFAAGYIKWMSDLKCPLYMQDQQIVPHAISIPKDALLKEFGPFFFTSSFAWMMAMAIQVGAKQVGLFGIDMASRDEYILQRPGAFYFFMEAARRGCKMFAPYESDIFQPPMLYGYSDVTPYGRKMRARKTELTSRVSQMTAQKNQLDHDITYLQGALEDNDYMISIQGGVQDNSDLSYLDRLLKQHDEMVKPVSLQLPSQG